MDNFYEPKADLNTILNTVAAEGVPPVTVMQVRGERQAIETFPTITFSVGDNTPVYELEGTIGYQNIEPLVDIYTDTSIQSGLLLASLVVAMMSGSRKYILIFCNDVSDPSGKSHVTTRFKLIQ